MDAHSIANQLKALTLSFVQVGHHRFAPATQLPSRAHAFHSLHYIVGGKGSYTINGMRSPVQTGKAIFLRPRTVLEFGSDPEQPLELYNIQFELHPAPPKQAQTSTATEPAAPPDFPLFGIYTVDNVARHAALLKTIHSLSKNMDTLSYLYKRIHMEHLIAAIVSDLQNQEKTGHPGEAVHKVIRYISEHYHDELSIGQLADMAGLSAGHFTRLFRQTAGCSPKRYIVRLRMNRAKELLEFYNKNLLDIAKLVGYRDEFYFSRLFKKTVGVAPSDYSRLLGQDRE